MRTFGAAAHASLEGTRTAGAPRPFQTGTAPGLGATRGRNVTRGWLFGTGLFMLKTSGAGDVFVSVWGGIREERLDPGEGIVPDNCRPAALTASAMYAVRKHGGLKTAVLGGEMPVISGPVCFRTKNPAEFAGAAAPFMSGGAAWIADMADHGHSRHAS